MQYIVLGKKNMQYVCFNQVSFNTVDTCLLLDVFCSVSLSFPLLFHHVSVFLFVFCAHFVFFPPISIGFYLMSVVCVCVFF